MRRQTLEGTLEEQCAFLYQLAEEKAAQGNYAGAFHLLKEIVAHRPDYKDAAQRLEKVKQKKKEQRQLLLAGLFGAILFIGIGTLLQLSNDLLFILLAILGAVVGFAIANGFIGQKQSV